jgi:salicylate hydroxylase
MDNPQPPQAGIIGAGIAGLSAAIALRRAGWQCEVFERSAFKNEVGAAISVTPNATRCLEHWGFDFAKARPVENQKFKMMVGKDLQVIYNEEYPDLEQQYGYKIWSFHREDLHRGLLDLAVEQDEIKGPPAIIRLGCNVRLVDFLEGRMTLADGENIKKDLIIIADGAHVRCNVEEPTVFTNDSIESNLGPNDGPH